MLGLRPPLHCRWSLLALLGPATGIALAPEAQAAPEARAKVVWLGNCADRPSLERELRSRGVTLAEPAPGTSGSVTDAITVHVNVTPSAEPNGLHAELEVEDSRGGQESRQVEAGHCQELRAAVAWVLVVLAQERTLPKPQRPVDAPASQTAKAAPLPAASPRASVPDSLHPQGSVALRKSTFRVVRPADFGVRTALQMAAGFLPNWAWGPAFFVEHRPGGPKGWAFHLAGLELTSRPFRSDATDITVQRWAGRFGASLPPLGPLSFSGALELGLLRGSGSQLPRAGRDTLGWLAAQFAGRLGIPLLGGKLSGDLEAGLGFTPFVYEFRYNSGQPLERSERLELRLQIGITSHFKSPFP